LVSNGAGGWAEIRDYWGAKDLAAGQHDANQALRKGYFQGHSISWSSLLLPGRCRPALYLVYLIAD
jgi:hypothetical protein